MSPVTQFLITQGELSTDMISLLISLPFIVSIVGFSRYYIGVKTFNLYSAIILTVAYFLINRSYPGSETEKLFAGIIIGVVVTLVVMLLTILMENILKNIRMHYFPKVSLIFSLVIISLIGILIILEYLNLFNLNQLNLVGVILICLVFEKFINTYTKKKLKTSLQLGYETIILSLICYLFIIASPIQEFLFANPGLVLITLPINYLIGKYTGLRLSEYLRFEDILDKEEKPDESI